MVGAKCSECVAAAPLQHGPEHFWDGVSAMHMHRQCAAVSPVLSVQPLCQTSWRTQVGRKLDWGDLFPFWHMVLQAKLLISA